MKKPATSFKEKHRFRYFPSFIILDSWVINYGPDSCNRSEPSPKNLVMLKLEELRDPLSLIGRKATLRAERLSSKTDRSDCHSFIVSSHGRAKVYGTLGSWFNSSTAAKAEKAVAPYSRSFYYFGGWLWENSLLSSHTLSSSSEARVGGKANTTRAAAA